VNPESRCRLPSIRLFGVVSLTGCLVAAACLHAQEPTSKKDEFPVKMTATASKPDANGNQQIVVTLTIQKGYHVHANPPRNVDLEGYEVRMKVMGKNLTEARISYPEGELAGDKAIGTYRIYQGKVTFKADVRRPNRDTEPLLVSVFVRPFDHIGCRWLPRSLKETVP
jgi:hypothetical protein